MAGKVALLLWDECHGHRPDTPGTDPNEAETSEEMALGAAGSPEDPKASRGSLCYLHWALV